MAFASTTLAGRVFLLVTSAIGVTLMISAMNPKVVAGVLVVAIPLAALASRYITNLQVPQSQPDLEIAYLEFVETMANVLDARDPYTAGHSLRVAGYAHAIACEMGMSAHQAEEIRIAAQLHDMGKIGLPDAVLQKPGTLTPEEYGLIKLHPQIGRRMLEKVAGFSQLLDIVELHHENYDGTGYPYKLSGDRIPLGVRIVHVADAFDAMTTNRSYRSALPLYVAIDELRTKAGTQLDPDVVAAFLAVLAGGKHRDLLAGIDHGLLTVSETMVVSETVHR